MTTRLMESQDDISRMPEFDPPPLLETTLDLERSGWAEDKRFIRKYLLLLKVVGGSIRAKQFTFTIVP